MWIQKKKTKFVRDGSRIIRHIFEIRLLFHERDLFEYFWIHFNAWHLKLIFKSSYVNLIYFSGVRYTFDHCAPHAFYFTNELSSGTQLKYWINWKFTCSNCFRTLLWVWNRCQETCQFDLSGKVTPLVTLICKKLQINSLDMRFCFNFCGQQFDYLKHHHKFN